MFIASLSDKEDTLEQLADSQFHDLSALDRTLRTSTPRIPWYSGSLQNTSTDSIPIWPRGQWSTRPSVMMKWRPLHLSPDADESTYHSLSPSFLSQLSGEESEALVSGNTGKNYSVRHRARSKHRRASCDPIQSTPNKTNGPRVQKTFRAKTINYGRPMSRPRTRKGLLKELTYQMMYRQPSTELMNADKLGPYQAMSTMRTSIQNLCKAYGNDCVNQALKWANARQRRARTQSRKKRLKATPTVVAPKRSLSLSDSEETEACNWIRLMLVLPTKLRKDQECGDMLRFRIRKDAPMVVLMMAIAKLLDWSEPTKIKMHVQRKRGGSTKKLVKPCDNVRTLGLARGDSLVLHEQMN